MDRETITKLLREKHSDYHTYDVPNDIGLIISFSFYFVLQSQPTHVDTRRDPPEHTARHRRRLTCRVTAYDFIHDFPKPTSGGLLIIHFHTRTDYPQTKKTFDDFLFFSFSFTTSINNILNIMLDNT